MFAREDRDRLDCLQWDHTDSLAPNTWEFMLNIKIWIEGRRRTLPAALTSLTKGTQFIWIFRSGITLATWLQTPGESEK